MTKTRAKLLPNNRLGCGQCEWSCPLWRGRGRTGWGLLASHIVDMHDPAFVLDEDFERRVQLGYEPEDGDPA